VSKPKADHTHDHCQRCGVLALEAAMRASWCFRLADKSARKPSTITPLVLPVGEGT
jgi:hypothetical protein